MNRWSLMKLGKCLTLLVFLILIRSASGQDSSRFYLNFQRNFTTSFHSEERILGITTTIDNPDDIHSFLVGFGIRYKDRLFYGLTYLHLLRNIPSNSFKDHLFFLTGSYPFKIVGDRLLLHPRIGAGVLYFNNDYDDATSNIADSEGRAFGEYLLKLDAEYKIIQNLHLTFGFQYVNNIFLPLVGSLAIVSIERHYSQLAVGLLFVL